jgi:small subunit ribosomal protein S19
MSRSSWKLNYLNTRFLKVDKKINLITVYSRSETIRAEYIGLNAKIYNGIRFYEIKIIEAMVGYKFGEFSSTRRFPKHKKKK